MDNRIHLLIITLLLISGISIYTHQTTESNQPIPVTVTIQTGADTGATSTEYGLLKEWQAAYNGTGNHNYNLNSTNPTLQVTEECGNCHMEAASTSPSWTNKHRPPLHPIATEGTNYSGNWFHDDNQHRGPNTQLAAQTSGILPGVQCGACHTPTTPSTSFADTSTPLTNDPHSVHRDVLTREGCIRCHVYNNRTFNRIGNGYNGIAFTQGNATRTTYGIANPINMTRVWDGVFLSTPDEANYTYTAGGTGLSTAGSGWNRYGNPETSRATQYGCGDCHDQFHAQQGYANTDGNGIEFAFNDSASSRKGPYAPVKNTNSWGINASGTIFTCGKCHPTDAHAVHTNGLINSKASYTAVNDDQDQTIINTGVLGAELCDECHSQNIASPNTGHTSNQAERGLSGIEQQFGPSSHNRLPDLNSDEAGSADEQHEDCGFCHYKRTLSP